MADTVVRHCSSPITVIVYTKYFAKTNTVIGEGQCRTTVSAIKTDLTRPWYLVSLALTYLYCKSALPYSADQRVLRYYVHHLMLLNGTLLWDSLFLY